MPLTWEFAADQGSKCSFHQRRWTCVTRRRGVFITWGGVVLHGWASFGDNRHKMSHLRCEGGTWNKMAVHLKGAFALRVPCARAMHQGLACVCKGPEGPMNVHVPKGQS